MTELILIKTNESQKVKTLLEREHIAYETYQEEKPKKTSEAELEQAYREAYADPERLKLTKEWEKTALKDLNKRSEKIYKKGEIYWFELEEGRKPKGGETQKSRPGVIISNDKQNKFSTVVIIVLLTSKLDKVYPFEVVVKVKDKENKILTDQV